MSYYGYSPKYDQTFEVGDFVICTASSYENIYCTSIISYLETPDRYKEGIHIYQVIGTSNGSNGQLIMVDGPFNMKRERIQKSRYCDPKVSKHKASNFRCVNSYMIEVPPVSNQLVITSQNSVRAVVFDVETGSLVGKFGSQEDAQKAVNGLLRKYPAKSYDVFGYIATGSLPEVPTEWADKTVKIDKVD